MSSETDSSHHDSTRRQERKLPIVVHLVLIALIVGVSTWVIAHRVPRGSQISDTLPASDYSTGVSIASHEPIAVRIGGIQPHTNGRGTQPQTTATTGWGTPVKPGTPGIPVPIGTLPATGTPGSSTSTGISPLLFGTNLGLFDSSDQVLTSATTRTTLQQIHTAIIRMPVRPGLAESVEVQAAQDIKSMGAIPLVALNGALVSNPLAADTIIINDMNRIFGTGVVYYEYGNEEDLNGISVNQYVASWNSVVPQLKKLALNGRFVGPVNYQYDPNYLTSFLQAANPRPDDISWHEYTCDDSWAQSICISHIANWTTHIQGARAIMMATINTLLPIMITEWNYAPNAVANDGKNNDSAFMSTWTSTALQTLAANHIFASMQYSCTNTAIPMIDSSGASTVQGATFKQQYETLIHK